LFINVVLIAVTIAEKWINKKTFAYYKRPEQINLFFFKCCENHMLIIYVDLQKKSTPTLGVLGLLGDEGGRRFLQYHPSWKVVVRRTCLFYSTGIHHHSECAVCVRNSYVTWWLSQTASGKRPSIIICHYSRKVTLPSSTQLVNNATVNANICEKR